MDRSSSIQMLSSARLSLAGAWRGVGAAALRISLLRTSPALLATILLPQRHYISEASAPLQQQTESGQVSSGEQQEDEERRWRRELEEMQQKRKGSNWDYGVELSALSARLGHGLDKFPSLSVALTYRASSGTGANVAEKKPSGRGCHGERLARLGRTLLDFYVTEYLFFTYPNLRGHHLHDVQASVTDPEVTARIANHVGVTDLLLTPDEEPHSSLAAKGLEAVLGALYVDHGPAAAKKLVHGFVLPQLANADFSQFIKAQHPKFMLRAILRGMGKPPPVARLLRESGRLTHFPSFVVGVYSGEQLLAEGCGTSLKRAEREAASAALKKYFQTEVSHAPLPSDHEDFQAESQVVLMEDEGKGEGT